MDKALQDYIDGHLDYHMVLDVFESFDRRIGILEHLASNPGVVVTITQPIDPWWTLSGGEKRIILQALVQNLHAESPKQVGAEVELARKLRGDEHNNQVIAEYAEEKGWA